MQNRLGWSNFGLVMNDDLKQLLQRYSGCEAGQATRLKTAGSNRIYYRMACDGDTIIGVEGTNPDENAAFIGIGRHLRSQKLPVPEILAVSDSGMSYLLQDLGDDPLYELMGSARESGHYEEEHVRLLEKTMSLLPDLQFKGGSGLDFKVCFPCESFDRRSILWDLNYFKYNFLKLTGVEFHEARLEDDFEAFVTLLLRDAPYDTFMYRDFQARNVMILDEEPWFIDFQGGRHGPIEYDVASFLWQASAAYPDELKTHLIDIYLKSLERCRNVSREVFLKNLFHFAMFRTLQVLGAYGFRGYFERKLYFIKSIPAAISNLRTLLDAGVGAYEYPYLTEVLQRIVDLPQFALADKGDDGRLTVRIISFSYRYGIPDDNSGNGGGFVFDCRGLHNPGMYERFRQFTGADAAVIEFLEKEGEVQSYLDNVYRLVDMSVGKYLKRGFTNLMVAFGCTGGRHRSLYCANHLAEHLKEKFAGGIRILLEHREQNISEEL